ncbi:MAG: alpha/beta hydrolase [Bacteroidia bacterium]|nr:alpha/beta hydrolase [Bacteroidia bacterium]
MLGFSPAVQYPGPLRTLSLPTGESVTYLRLGSRQPTLLFVHGLASHSPVWQHNLGPLSEWATCVALDLPGHGRSAIDGVQPSLVYYADVLAEVVRSLGLGPVVPVGHSMGGQISVIFALRYPWLVSRLVLVAPAGFEVYSEKDKELIQSQFESFPVSSVILLRYYNRALSHNPLGKVPPAQKAQVLVEADSPAYARVLARCISAMLREPIYPYLGQLTVPTLVIFGDDDGLIPNPALSKATTRSIAQAATARIPKGRLAMVPGAGHFVQYEYPTVVNDHIEQFLRG